MAEEQRTENDTLASTSGDYFCDLCKLDFTTKEELKEHSWTMLHHGKLNKAKGRDCVHECSLCEETFVELLSFTKHLHADTHQERYNTWKKQQRSKEWRVIENSHSPSLAATSEEMSFHRRTKNTQQTRKNSNGKNVSFRTLHQSQRNAKGAQHVRKRKGNRIERHFQQDGNPFQFKPLPADNLNMDQERDFGLQFVNTTRKGRQFTGRGPIRTGSPYIDGKQYPNYSSKTQERSSSQTSTYNISNSMSSDLSREDSNAMLESSWTMRLRRANRQFSQNTTEQKDLDDHFPKRSSRRRKDNSLGYRDNSLFVGDVGENGSNGNSRPNSASPVMGEPSRTCITDNTSNPAGRVPNDQTNDSDLCSEFIPEKRRNNYGNRQNRPRYFRNRTWVCDALKSRVGDNQSVQTYNERTFGSSEIHSADVSQFSNSNCDGMSTRSAAKQSEQNNNQQQLDSFKSFSFTSADKAFEGSQLKKSIFSDRDTGMSRKESRGSCFNDSLDRKDADERVCFTFGFADAAGCGNGIPEDSSQTEVIQNDQIPLQNGRKDCHYTFKSSVIGEEIQNCVEKGIENFDETLKSSRSSSSGSIKDGFSTDGFKLQSRGMKKNVSKSEFPFPSVTSVTDTSSLRRTSPRLRSFKYVTLSQNSDRSSVVESSAATNTSIDFEQKKQTQKNNSEGDEEVERLNKLIKMKKEPCDSTETAETTGNVDFGGRQETESTPGDVEVNSQARCSFVHIDGVHCEAVTSERYCSYHQRFPQGNLIKTEPNMEFDGAVSTTLNLLDSSVSPATVPRDLSHEKNGLNISTDIERNNVISSRSDAQSHEDTHDRFKDLEQSDVRNMIKSRRDSQSYENMENNPSLSSNIYFHGQEQISERVRKQHDAKTTNSNENGAKASNSNVEMMDLSMSTNFLVLPHSQAVTSTNSRPTISNRTSPASFSNWPRNGGAQSWKDPKQNSYWNLQSSSTVVVSSSGTVSQQCESPVAKWTGSSNTKAEPTERRTDVPVSPISTPPSLSECRKSSVSPVSPSVKRESNISPISGSSIPSLDLSRLNLPPHVRRALAQKYAAKKQTESVPLATSLAPNLSGSRNRFVEAKKDSLDSHESKEAPLKRKETPSKQMDTQHCKPPITSNVLRGRLRQQRSISLDSCPTSRSTLLPEVPNTYGRLGSLQSYDRFPTTMNNAVDSHLSRYSSANILSSANAKQGSIFSDQTKMIDLSASNYIPSLKQSGTSQERQYKDSETTASNAEKSEFGVASAGRALDQGTIYSHRALPLEKATSYKASNLRSVRSRTASIERDSGYLRVGSAEDHPLSSRLVSTTDYNVRGDRFVSGANAEAGISNPKETDISQPQFNSGYQTAPRPLISHHSRESNNAHISLESDVGSANLRSLDSIDHKERDGGYIALESRARSTTPDRSSADVTRLRQYGLLDLRSTAASSMRIEDQNRGVLSISESKPFSIIFPGMSNLKSTDNYDLSSSKRKTIESDTEEHNKRRKATECSSTEKEPLSYLPGIEVQELLNLEHEEQKQLKSLQEVQAKVKATRLKLQSLSIELEHLNAQEKKISSEISSTKNKRLEILQGALRGNRKNTETRSPSGMQTFENNAPTISQFQKNTSDFKENNNSRDRVGGLYSTSDVQTDSTKGNSHDYDIGLMQSGVKEHNIITSQSDGNANDVVVKIENDREIESISPHIECLFSLSERAHYKDLQLDNAQIMTGESETCAAKDSECPINDRNASLHETLLNTHNPQGDIGVPHISQVGPSASSPQNKEEWVSEHFEKSRKEFFKKIKHQLSTPKKRQQNKKQRKRFSETKVSNSLAMSKERIQLVRERMRGWKRDGDTVELSSTRQNRPSPCEQETTTSTGNNVEVDVPTTCSTVYKETTLTPSKIPVRDVGVSEKETSNETKTSNNSQYKNKSELKGNLKSKNVLRKKRKSVNPMKKTSSRSGTTVKSMKEHPQTVTQKEIEKNTKTDERVQHTVAAESLKHKLQRKAKASKSLSTSKERASVFEGHTGAVCALKVSQGKLFTCSADKTTKAFDIQTGVCVKEYKGHHQAVNCLEISENGERLFTGSNDQTVRSYNTKTGVCTHKFTFDGRVMCLHIGIGLLYVGLSSGIVTLIDLTTNKCAERLHCHEPRAVSCLATATEGQRTLLCTGSFDATISIRDHETGLLFKTLTSHSMTVLCIQVVDSIIYSGAADGKVLAHNLNTGEVLRRYNGHTLSVSSLQVVGRVLVTSCLDKLIRCYDLMSAELLQAYGGQSDMVFSVHLSNGRIYSGTRDGKVSSLKLDLRVYHPCKWKDCQLNFGIVAHMKEHIKDFHIIQQGSIEKCLWADCAHVFKESDDIQTILDHVHGHLKSSKTLP